MAGPWTERKLAVVRRYLEAYAHALKNQPFQRIYIDAFAGTGGRQLEKLPLLDLPERELFAKGSARLALEVNPPFDRYVLIERATRRAGELAALVAEHPNRNIEVINQDANEAIARLCKEVDWLKTRGVVFLDPYGMQLSWNTLLAIARTKRLDIWLLVPTGMGLNRLLTKDGNVPEEWQNTLDRFLGTEEWRSHFYRVEKDMNLFGEAQHKRVKEANATKFEAFVLERLRGCFPIVLDRGMRLTNSKGQVMYLLCFASANPSPKVKALAPKLARWAARA
jgi:three-Cys-motif partner protein